jgi:hypothetical protein
MPRQWHFPNISARGPIERSVQKIIDRAFYRGSICSSSRDKAANSISDKDDQKPVAHTVAFLVEKGEYHPHL